MFAEILVILGTFYLGYRLGENRAPEAERIFFDNERSALRLKYRLNGRECIGYLPYNKTHATKGYRLYSPENELLPFDSGALPRVKAEDLGYSFLILKKGAKTENIEDVSIALDGPIKIPGSENV
jgi:hypothetical protein